MSAIICSFASAIGDMKPADQRDEMKVLAVLARNPRFSVFDATERDAIAQSLDSLKTRGLIEYPQPQPGYPWCKVQLTEAGEKAIQEPEFAALPAGDYPECSGDPTSCPENEGRGCCKPNPSGGAVCNNCGTPLPEGCSLIFRADGKACLLNRQEQSA